MVSGASCRRSGAAWPPVTGLDEVRSQGGRQYAQGFEDNLRERNNLWMLHNAVALAGKNLTLVALGDGQRGDGPGGTEDMVQQVEKLNARTIVRDTTTELGL